HTKRGISCDAWSAYFTDGKSNHPPNTLFTWYFANAQWMKSNGFGSSNTFPVAVEVQQDTTSRYLIQIVTMRDNQPSYYYFLFGWSFSLIYCLCPFRVYVRCQLIVFIDLLFMSVLGVQPTSASDIIVIFKLLDIASINTQGDVTLAQRDAPNSQILADLCQSINSGNFVIEITS
ncbi:unnamed protein product, partial [Candidula unifasciata]